MVRGSFWSARSLASTAVLASAALVGSGLVVASVATPAAAAGSARRTVVSSAADVVSAQAAARAQSSKVLVDGLTSATDQVWANPDGSLTREVSLGQERVRQADGSWSGVDLDLVPGPTGITSRVPAVPVTYASAGQSTVASAAIKSEVVSVGWDTPLPAPVLQGSTATYPEVRPGVDLVVQALRSGFEVNFVVRVRPVGALSLPLTLTLPAGLDASQGADGSLAVTDTASGASVFQGGSPVMFGAARDAGTNLPTKSRGVLDTLGSRTVVGAASRRTWTLSPDPAFFADPTLTFPATVDPTFNVLVSSDTYVKTNVATAQDSATRLYVGTPDSGVSKARILLHLNAIPSTLSGMWVDEAHLRMFNSYSATCTASLAPVNLWRANAWSAGALWATQPGSPDTSPQSTSYFVHNGPNNGCGAAAYDDMDLTALARNWASGAATSKDFKILSSESDSHGWKEFYSAENGSGVPRFYFTYRAYPVPAKPIANGISNGYTYWAPTLTPTLSSKVTSATGNTVQGKFQVYSGSTLLWEGLGSTVASGATSTVTVPAAVLANLSTYTLYVYGVSGGAVSATRSDYARVSPDVGVPGATTVSSTQFPSGQWTNGVSDGTFSFSASDDFGVSYYRWGLDASPPVTVQAAGTPSITLSPVPGGWHHLYVQAVDRAGNAGAIADYPFGAGSGLVSPADGAVTQASVDLIGSTAPGASQVSFYWRRAATADWALLPTGKVTPGSGSPAFTGWPYSFPALVGNGASTPTLRWDVAGMDANLTGPVQVGTCFGDATACPAAPGATLPTGGNASNVPANVTLDRNAFNIAETSSLGPVGVNLLTGNTQFGASDVSVPGTGGTSLSVSRVLNTTTVASTPGNAALGVGNYLSTGIFGPGWTGSLPVDSAGSDWTGLIDTGDVLTLQGPDQSTVGFTPGTGAKTGTWQPVGDDTDSLLSLKVSDAADCTSGYRCLTLTDGDNVTTVFQSLTAGTTVGTLAAPVTLGVTKVTEPGTPSATTFARANGLFTRIVSPVPTGQTCSDPSGSLTWTAACRGLSLTYGDGTAGKPLGQLVAATYLTNVSGAALQVDVACFGYDSNNRLVDSWDPRDIPTASAGSHPIGCGATPLRATHYSYDAAGRVNKITPAWDGTGSPLAGTDLSYDAGGRLSHVDRTHLTGYAAGTETTSVAYGVPLTADGTHPEYRPEVSNTSGWGQHDSPDPAVGGTVICPPGAAQATATGDLRDCTVSYLDGNGRVVNTASYSGTGATGWHLSTTEFDTQGHITRTLDAADREEALSPTTGAGAALLLPADPAVAASIVSTVNLYAPNASDGTLDLTDTFGPYHQVALPDVVNTDGTITPGDVVTARAHTHLTYDTGSEAQHPAGGSLHLVMTSVTAASISPTLIGTAETDQRTSSNSYAVGTDGSGWTYRTPLQTSTDPSGLNIVRQATLDAQGRVIRSQMPNDVASLTPGSTSGTTITVYYSKDTISGADSDCGNHPEWDGLVCKTYPANTTAGGIALPTSSAPGLISTKIISYDYLNRPTGTVETPASDTGNARTKTSVFGFNSTITGGVSANPYANAVTQASTTGGLGTSLPAQTISYDTASGLPTATSDGSTADSSSYDDFGRVIAYTENTGASGTQTNVANTVYDPSTGRVSSRRDQHQRTSYTYNGGSEHRGLPTSTSVDVTASNNGAALWTGSWTGAYDSNAALLTQTDPNGVSSTLSRDEAGQLLSRADTLAGAVWLTDSLERSIHGQAISHRGPAGTQRYGYDAAGRLSLVQERPAGGTGSCTVRGYGFDRNSNRTAKTSYPVQTDGSCKAASGTGTVVSSAYDTADRIQTTGTVYDSFGRTTTAPASTITGGADLTVGYDANDLVRSQTQGSGAGQKIQTWALDQSQQRLRSWTLTTGGSTTASRTNHYDDPGGDSPDWIAESADATSWTTNVSDLLGSLAVTVDQAGVPTFQYANVHGDIQATNAAGASAATIGPLYDEYGNVITGAAAPRYGWLGGKQRSDEDLAGLTLMGVRLYNSTLGRFLSVDPVPGGSANSYDYANQDPINGFDLDGRQARDDTADGDGGYNSHGDSLSQREIEAIADKEAGNAYDKSAYKSAKRKLKNQAKYGGTANVNKQRGGPVKSTSHSWYDPRGWHVPHVHLPHFHLPHFHNPFGNHGCRQGDLACTV